MSEPARALPPLPGARPPRPPKHLSRTARAWWVKITRTWRLDPHHIEILTHAATCLDRAEAARQIVAAKGQFVQDRYGQHKENPACKAERDSMALFARLVRELGLDPDPPEEARPPLLRNRYVDRA